MEQSVFVAAVRYGGVLGVFSEEGLAEDYLEIYRRRMPKDEYIVTESTVDELVGES